MRERSGRRQCAPLRKKHVPFPSHLPPWSQAPTCLQGLGRGTNSWGKRPSDRPTENRNVPAPSSARGKRRELPTDHKKKSGIQKGRLVFERRRLRHNLEKLLRVRGAHLHASAAGVGSEQPCGDVAVLLRERQLAQHQGLHTQGIDDVDRLQSFRETPLKALRRLAGHASKQ